MMFNTITEAAEYAEDRLQRWGATRIDVINVREETGSGSIDFATPFPGDQPIRSSIVFDGPKVEQAAVRYGVLDAGKFIGHPTHDPGQIDRLKLVATRSGVPNVGSVVVNYGDDHHPPRPHLMLGWDMAVKGEETIVTMNDTDRRYPVDDVLGTLERFGDNVRREFRGEWVE